MKNVAFKRWTKHCFAEASFRLGVTDFASRRTSPNWRILTYHRVVDPATSPVPLQPGMYVSPTTFRMHMAYLAENTHVLSLEKLYAAIKANEPILPRTTCIVFDDGWRDNYVSAFPILKEWNIPASICLATAFIGTPRRFWTDHVVESLTQLSKDKQHHHSILSRIYSLPVTPSLHTAIQQFVVARGKDVAADRILEQLKLLSPSFRKQFLNTLDELVGDFELPLRERIFMNWDEVLRMSQNGISFLSHTHEHHNMTEIHEEQILDEVQESLQCFYDRNISVLPALCYPGGYYNTRTQFALARTKIQFALGVQRNSEMHVAPPVLGRIGIHNDVSDTLPKFAARLWLAGF